MAYGSEHTHVVARDSVHVMSGSGNTSKDIATPQHQADLYSGASNFSDLTGQKLNALRIEAEGQLTGQSLTADL